MKTSGFPLLAISATLFLLLAQCTAPDSDREANRLFVEAFRQVETALQIEEEDPVAAYENYRGALDNIEMIIERFPGTQIAVSVTQHQTLVGELTIGELRRKVPVLRARASALDDFEKLALYLIRRTGDEVDQAEKLKEYALIAYKNGRTDLYERLISDIARQADIHWSVEKADRINLFLTQSHAQAKNWQYAMTSAEQIQDRRILNQALSYMVESGFPEKDVPHLHESFLLLMEYLSPEDHVLLLARMTEHLYREGMADRVPDLQSRALPSPEERNRLDYIEALTVLSGVYSRNEAFDASMSVIHLIESLDDRYSGFAMRELATELARRHQLEKALELARSLENEYFRSTSVTAIAVEHAKNGFVARSLAMLDTIPDHLAEKMTAHSELIDILVDFGDYQRADSLLASYLESVGQHASAHFRIQSDLWLSNLHKKRNHRSRSVASLQQAEEKIRALSDPAKRNQFITDAAQLWIQLGRPDRATELAGHYAMDHESFLPGMQRLMIMAADTRYRELPVTLSILSRDAPLLQFRLAEHYLQNEDFGSAVTIAYDIRSYYWRSLALGRLSGKLAAAGRVLDAEKSATDALLTAARIRDDSQSADALLHTALHHSVSGFEMSAERRDLTGPLLSRISL